MKTSLKLIGGRKIISPKTDQIRPTTLMVRQAIFNILGGNVEDSSWLDLFSGSGSIACEAYNHGAKKITAVERNKKNAELCLKNLFSLKDSQKRTNDIKVICKDVFSWINSQNNLSFIKENTNFEECYFDFIYVDPPYEENYYEILLKKLFNSNFIKKDTLVIYESGKSKIIDENPLWKVHDIRLYGQTKLTFLIKI